MKEFSPEALLRSATVKSALFYALTGVGFSGAHLLLAKFLPTVEYAVIALAVAVVNLGREISPFGAQGVVLRHRRLPDRPLLMRVIWSCAVVGAAFALCTGGLYELEWSTMALLFAGIAAAGVTQVAAAVLQSRQAFASALFLSQSANLSLLIAAFAVAVIRIREAWFPLALFAGGFFASALWSWTRLLREPRGPASAPARYPWREALSYAMVSVAVPVMVQAERLSIPMLLSLEDLAAFGVVAAIVISPYRTLQMGASFTVLPRIRAAPSPADRRRLLKREFLTLTGLVAAGSLTLAWLTPLIVDFIYRDKFDITHGLIRAAIVVGALKAYSGLAKAVAMALCTTRELGVLGLGVWASLGVAVAGAAVGASWGLSGLVLGIGAGWVTLLIAYTILGARHLRD